MSDGKSALRFAWSDNFLKCVDSVQAWRAMDYWGRRPLNNWSTIFNAYILFPLGLINIFIGGLFPLI
jgi:hypothetical protein